MHRGRLSLTVNRVPLEGAPRAAQVLARAFVDDPLALWPMRSDIDVYEGVLVQLEPLARGYAELGVLWESGEGTGFAAWLPPALVDRAEAIWSGTKDQLRAIFPDDGARYSAQWSWMGEHVPDDPVWFLEIIGVDPAAQGGGVGAALIEHGIERSQAAGEPAFLETSIAGNVAYYERFGFGLVEEGDVPDGGPHVWFMRRDPLRP